MLQNKQMLFCMERPTEAVSLTYFTLVNSYLLPMHICNRQARQCNIYKKTFYSLYTKISSKNKMNLACKSFLILPILGINNKNPFLVYSRGRQPVTLQRLRTTTPIIICSLKVRSQLYLLSSSWANMENPSSIRNLNC